MSGSTQGRFVLSLQTLVGTALPNRSLEIGLGFLLLSKSPLHWCEPKLLKK